MVGYRARPSRQGAVGSKTASRARRAVIVDDIVRFGFLAVGKPPYPAPIPTKPGVNHGQQQRRRFESIWPLLRQGQCGIFPRPGRSNAAARSLRNLAVINRNPARATADFGTSATLHRNINIILEPGVNGVDSFEKLA